jgi:hypothetical protein
MAILFLSYLLFIWYLLVYFWLIYLSQCSGIDDACENLSRNVSERPSRVRYGSRFDKILHRH